MNAVIWGPSTWHLLHQIVENYSPLLHSSYQALVYSLAACLPCKICRNNFVLKIVENPFPCKKTKVVLRKWLIEIHNQVNIDNNKPRLSYKRALEQIKKQRKLTKKDVNKVIGFMEKNLAQNKPPPQYKTGLNIFKKNLHKC